MMRGRIILEARVLGVISPAMPDRKRRRSEVIESLFRRDA